LLLLLLLLLLLGLNGAPTYSAANKEPIRY